MTAGGGLSSRSAERGVARPDNDDAPPPAVTLVIATRNDGYGERLKDRLYLHCRSIDAFADELGLPLEHLVVEWNPLPAWDPLGAILPLPRSRLVTRRIVHAAGPEVAEEGRRRDRSFLEYVAKNVGIRRAAAPLVVAMNQDIVLTPEFGRAFRSWREAPEAEGTFLRADRLDIVLDGSEYDLPAPFTTIDALARRRLIRRRNGDVDCRGLGIEETLASGSTPGEMDACLPGWILGPAERDVASPKPGMGAGWWDGSGRGLHYHCSGDIVAARRDAFLAADGFFEGQPWPSHPDGLMDGLMIARFHGLGLRQAILSFPAFVAHVDHGRGDFHGCAWEDVAPILERLIEGERYPGQPGGWGLEAVSFRETVIAPDDRMCSDHDPNPAERIAASIPGVRPESGRPWPAGQDPGITVVTAFFDLGRSDWQVFARSTDTYFDRFGNLARLAVPMVVFTSPDLADRVMAARTAAGHADLTTVVTVDDVRTVQPGLRAAISAVQQDERFQRFVLDRNVPKWWNPDYVVLGHLKPAWVTLAVDAGLVRTPLVAWGDFGCCRVPIADGPVAIAGSAFDPRKVHAFTRYAFDPGVPAELMVKHGDPPVTSELVVATPENWRELGEAWADQLDRLLGQGLVDDADAVLQLIWRDRPDFIELHDLSASGNPWRPVIQYILAAEAAMADDAEWRTHVNDAAHRPANSTIDPGQPPAFGSAAELLDLGRAREEEEDWDGAIAAYSAGFGMADTPEQAGWAAYLAAAVLGERLGRWTEAEAVSVQGIAVDPCRPDLHWLAGLAAYHRGAPGRAAAWARAAVALNHAADHGLIPEHAGPTFEAARCSAPWDLLQHALFAVGDDEGARQAEEALGLAPYVQMVVARNDHSHAAGGSLRDLGLRIRRAEADTFRQVMG